jgi:hypothetical protein
MAFVLMLALHHTAWAQGIVYGYPQQPIYYSAGVADYETNVDINGDGTPDFTIISTSSYDADIAPLGSNSIIAIPEIAPDVGYFVAALSNGVSIGSSLEPIPGAQWYSQTTDQFGRAAIGSQAQFGGQPVVIGYFAGKPSAYVGFDLVDSGVNYYGWMQLSNPLNLVYGQVVDWAYESKPDTPIFAGEVPEPSMLALLTLGALFALFRRR